MSTAQLQKIPLTGSIHEFATLYRPECLGKGVFQYLAPGLLRFWDQMGGVGVMDAKGRIMIPSVYGWTGFRAEPEAGVLRAVKGALTILFDFQGVPLAGRSLKELLTYERGIPVLDSGDQILILDELASFSENLARGKKGNSQIYIDTRGRVQIRLPEKMSGSDFQGGMAAVAPKSKLFRGKKYGYINTRGEQVIPPQYTNAKPFYDGFAAVRDDKTGWHYIRPDGSRLKTFFPQESTHLSNWKDMFQAGNFVGDYAPVLIYNRDSLSSSSGGALCLLHKSGAFCCAGFHELRETFENGVFQFSSETYKRKTGKCYGLTDGQGKILLEEKYQQIVPAGHERFVIQENGRYGLADKTGKIVAPPVWDFVFLNIDHEGFSMDHAVMVEKNGLRGLLDFQGNVLLPPVYSGLILYNGDLILVHDGKETRLLNQKQQLAIPDDVEILDAVMHGLLTVKWNGETYLLDYGCNS